MTFPCNVPCWQCHRPWQVTSANHPMQNAQCHHWNLAARYKRKRKKKERRRVVQNVNMTWSLCSSTMPKKAKEECHLGTLVEAKEEGCLFTVTLAS